jgi:phosphoribosylamine--glycine ligase
VLVVGSGAREHALAWKLAQSPSAPELHAAPGSPGTAALGECHAVAASDAEGLVRLARRLRPGLVVVGPEAPLVAGLADDLRAAGILVFGPSRAAAQIEGSKTFAKDVLRAAGVASAAPLPEPRPPCVVKADGLAAGKGVFICRTPDELDAGLEAASAFGGPVVVEELLDGEELSVFALCDGRRVLPLGAARDFKRIGDGDTGPNTGGMGSYTPVPGFDAAEVERLVDAIHRPVLAELTRRGSPFSGVLFAGLMLTDDGPRVLEFNCRFGDPEAQSLLPLLAGDLLDLLAAAATGTLEPNAVAAAEGAAVTVVVASGGYPARSADFGTPIEGVETAVAAGALVFHAGTAWKEGRLVTNGGRILSVTGLGETVEEARRKAYAGVGRISLAGARYRRDIAAGLELARA